MMLRKTIAVALCWSLTAPGWAQLAPRPVPGLTGTELGVDPAVAAYEAQVTSLTGQAKDLKRRAETGAVTAGMQSELATLQEKVEAAKAERARLEAAGKKAREHLAHAAGLRGPAFEEKQDAAVKPHEDATLRRSETAPAAPRLKPLASRFAYASTGGGVGAGFARPLPGASVSSFGLPSTPGVGSVSATVDSARDAGYSAPPPAAAGPGQAWASGSVGETAGTPATSGSAVGGDGMSAAAGSSYASIKVSANPSAETLSKNTSDVAKVAADRAEKAHEEKMQELQQQQQEQQQEQQMRMQMLMMLAQMLVQLAQLAKQDKKS